MSSNTRRVWIPLASGSEGAFREFPKLSIQLGSVFAQTNKPEVGSPLVIKVEGGGGGGYLEGECRYATASLKVGVSKLDS